MFKVCALALGVVMFLTRGLCAEVPKIQVKESADALEFTIDGKPFTTYRFKAQADDPEWHRPYFWPVLMADGTSITSDQARLQAEQKTPADKKKIDHPWHRSIYIAHGDINGLDHWTHKPGEKKLQQHIKFQSVTPDGFVEELAWEGKEAGKPVLMEVRTVQLIAYADGARGIDVTTVLTAVNGDAVFKVKPLNVSGVEAGWLAARVAPSISASKESVISSSAGAVGEKDSRVKPAVWCDYSGPINGKTYGIALFDHPDNAGESTPFHVRQFGLLTHIGIHDWTLKNGQSQTIRHRLLMHEGDGKSAKLDERCAEFTASKK